MPFENPETEVQPKHEFTIDFDLLRRLNPVELNKMQAYWRSKNKLKTKNITKANAMLEAIQHVKQEKQETK